MPSSKAFIISLPQEEVRRQPLIHQLTECGLDFSVFDAVHGAVLSERELEEAYDKEKAIRVFCRELSKGELGCALSHIALYRKMVEENIPYGLILEDDAKIIDMDLADTLKKLEGSFASTEPVAVIFNFVRKYLEVRGSDGVRLDDKHSVHSIYKTVYGAYGYFITHAAAAVLAKNLHPVFSVADNWRYFSRHYIMVKVLVPYSVALAPSSAESSTQPGVKSLAHPRKSFPIPCANDWIRRTGSSARYCAARFERKKKSQATLRDRWLKPQSRAVNKEATKNALRALRARATMLRSRMLFRTCGPVPDAHPTIYGVQEQRAAIPRTIWLYWDQAEVPPLVELCVARVRMLNPGCVVHFLTTGTLGGFIPALPDFSRVSVHKKADWIRLYLLDAYGGIWVDATILPTEPLDWVFELQEQARADYVGFYIQKFTRNPGYPVLENWFMASPPKGELVSRWFALFDQEVICKSVEAYLARLHDLGMYDQVLQAIDDPTYLTMHVAGQEVLQTLAPMPRIVLFRAEETAFLYQVRAGWKRERLAALLLHRAASAHVPMLVKLRGGDRKHFDFFLKRGLF